MRPLTLKAYCGCGCGKAGDEEEAVVEWERLALLPAGDWERLALLPDGDDGGDGDCVAAF